MLKGLEMPKVHQFAPLTNSAIHHSSAVGLALLHIYHAVYLHAGKHALGVVSVDTVSNYFFKVCFLVLFHV